MTNALRLKGRLSYGPPGSPPTTWEVGLAKRWVTVQSGDMISAVEETETGHPVIGGNGIRAFTDKTNTPADTLVVGRVGARCGCVHHIREDFWASEHAYRVIERRPLARRFFFHLLTALDLNRFAIKTAQPLLNTEIVETQLIAVPPLPEQTAIAVFLDRETGKIDALVEEQKRLIELLKEKRQAVISHAVTKGLDPNVPMKPSGIEWLGDVPEHWEVRPLRYSIGSITSGTSVNAIDEPALQGEVGVLKTSCVYRGRFEAVENKAVLPEELDRVSCPVVPDTIVVSRMNTPDLVGAAGLVTEEAPNIYLPDRLWQVRLRDGHAAYHHYWMQSASYRAQVRLACAGTSSSMQNLSQDDFHGFVLAVPPTPEQQAIARYLDATLAKSDDLVDHAERTVRLLQERRAALISAAVTGKIDVRELDQNKGEAA